jgi:hypothetical protein
MGHREQRVWTGVFLALIAWPLVFGLAGYAGLPIENRVLTEPPRFAPRRLVDPTFYGQLSDYLNDRLPFRGALVRANSLLAMRVWRDSPNPDVHIGRGNWLYTTSFKGAFCPGQMPLGVVRQLESLGRAMTRSHREMRFVLAPHKATLYPEFLGDPVPRDFACGIGQLEALRRELAQTPEIGFVDIWARLSALKATAPEPLYFPEDSHWTLPGATELSHALVDSIEPGLWRAGDVAIQREILLPMDLARLIGVPSAVPVALPETRRAGVKTTIVETQDCDAGPSCVVRYHSTTEEAPLIERRTLLVRDSFGTMSMATLAPYFRDITFLFWSEDLAAQMAARLAAADLVIYETFDQFVFRRVEQGFTEMALPPLSDPVK